MVVLSALALLSFTTATVYAGDGLNTRAEAAGGRYFGSATDNPELTDEPYVELLSNTDEFGQITCGNAMKWAPTEPSQGEFQWEGGDEIADLAEGNGQLLRCHTLVWHNQLPSWVENGGFDNETLIAVMENHITNVVTHFKGRCLHWDVVNEALNGDGTLRENVFYKTIGEAYLPIAFAAAAAADPDAKLYYNDFNIEWASDKTTGAQNIVKLIQSAGVRIDGVGLQAHLIVGNVNSAEDLTANLQSFTDLGVEVAYTELDIRTDTPATVEALEQQATDYANVVTSCKNVEKCAGVTVWDYTDRHSWIPATFPGQGAALPWDEDLQPKPAYYGILNAWGEARD